MRDAWLLQGRQLPVTMPYVLHVRFDHDPDAPEVPFPPCCVIGASGLTAQPVTADVQRRCEVTVAGMACAWACAWAGKGWIGVVQGAV